MHYNRRDTSQVISASEIFFTGVETSKPRTCRGMMNRENHDATAPTDYFRVVLTTTFVDDVINEINNRFGSAPTIAIK